MDRIDLFRYLSRPVNESLAKTGTRMTFVEAETYDDSGSLADWALLGTTETRVPGETYDDDDNFLDFSHS